MFPHALATLLLCLAGVSCVLHVIALVRLRGRNDAPSGDPGPALTFWRALKPGIPDFEGKLDALLAASRPSDQILLGVDAKSTDTARCEAWIARHPNRNIHLVRCEADRAANPKISKFLQMQSSASHPHWLLTDSESLLTQEFVESIRTEWVSSGADAVTAGYHFRSLRTVPQILDALPAAVTLWPGLMLTPRVRFTLGACTGIRASDLEAVGGWETIAQDLAEDHELGQRLTGQGKTVRLAQAILHLDSDPMTFADYLRHQHRVAVTYRVANPAGAAGLVMLHGTPMALLAVALHPQFWPLALPIVVARSVLAIIEARIAGIPRAILLAPLTPILEGIFWVIAWLPLPVWWAGQWRRVNSNGRLATRAIA